VHSLKVTTKQIKYNFTVRSEYLTAVFMRYGAVQSVFRVEEYAK
jgi:hypothetical protein